MSQNISIGEHQCGTCRHWKERILDTAPPVRSDVLEIGGSMDLTQPRSGECRYLPPQLLEQTVMDERTRKAFRAVTASYPVLQHDTPACSQHSA